MYQTVRCPNCRKVYSSGLYREKTGQPIALCVFCREYFIDKSVNEWELRGVFGKLYYILFTLTDVCVVGFVSAMAILFLIILPDLIFKTQWSAFMVNDGNNFIGLIVICTVINLVRVIVRESRDLKASKARMDDTKYRESLKTAGLLK